MTGRAVKSKVEEICELFICGYCGAREGERCKTPSGWSLAVSHGARFVAATKTGLLPLPQDQR